MHLSRQLRAFALDQMSKFFNMSYFTDEQFYKSDSKGESVDSQPTFPGDAIVYSNV